MTQQLVAPTTDILPILQQMDGLMFLGDTLLKSGLLPQAIKTKEAAIAIILKGREIGIGPMEAFSSIAVIQGKPTISPQLMIALAERSGQLENYIIQDDGEKCTVTVNRKGRSSFTASFSMEDAASMGLSGKDNWKKQPKVMRQWRAISAAFRVRFADVLAGMYTPEELGAEVDEAGTIFQEMPVETRSIPETAPNASSQEIVPTAAESAALEEGIALSRFPDDEEAEPFLPPFNGWYDWIQKAQKAKRKLCEVYPEIIGIGNEMIAEGELHYYDVLSEYGFEHSNDPTMTIEATKLLLREWAGLIKAKGKP